MTQIVSLAGTVTNIDDINWHAQYCMACILQPSTQCQTANLLMRSILATNLTEGSWSIAYEDGNKCEWINSLRQHQHSDCQNADSVAHESLLECSINQLDSLAQRTRD